MKFTLPYKLAIAHFLLSTGITVSWLWYPFYGLQLLERLDFVVFWDMHHIGKFVFFVVDHLRSKIGVVPSLTTLVKIGMGMFALSFVVLGTLQWLAIGLLLQRTWQALRRRSIGSGRRC